MLADEYVKILHRINGDLADVFGRGNRVNSWPCSLSIGCEDIPLPVLFRVGRSITAANINIAGLIRNTMNDVEEIARFQAPKYFACYADLITVYLESIDRHDLVERLFEINILLEFGVSVSTQLSLMGLGLSRSSGIALSELITDDSLDEAGCLNWLEEQNWMTEDMPALIKREISELLRNKDRK